MIIDLVVAAVAIISAIISFLRGFIREILTIAGVVAGFFAAVFFGPKLSPLFSKWLGVYENADGTPFEEGQEVDKLFDMIPMNIVADVCAYATVFILVVIIISVISHFTSGAAKAMGLGPVDRTLGVIFGLVRGIVLLSLLYLPFHLLMDQESKTKHFADSKTHYYIEKTAKLMARYLPSSDAVKDKVDGATDQAEETIKDKLLQNNILPNTDGAIEKIAPQGKSETGYEQQERGELEGLFEQPQPSSSATQ